MAADPALLERVRAWFADGGVEWREITMFGGVSFMVDEAMVVNVGSVHALLVRVDPDRADELLLRPGAVPAEMASGRSMGRSWISVDGPALATAAALDAWLDVALRFRRGAPG